MVAKALLLFGFSFELLGLTREQKPKIRVSQIGMLLKAQRTGRIYILNPLLLCELFCVVCITLKFLESHLSVVECHTFY